MITSRQTVDNLLDSQVTPPSGKGGQKTELTGSDQGGGTFDQVLSQSRGAHDGRVNPSDSKAEPSTSASQEKGEQNTPDPAEDGLQGGKGAQENGKELPQPRSVSVVEIQPQVGEEISSEEFIPATDQIRELIGQFRAPLETLAHPPGAAGMQSTADTLTVGEGAESIIPEEAQLIAEKPGLIKPQSAVPQTGQGATVLVGEKTARPPGVSGLSGTLDANRGNGNIELNGEGEKSAAQGALVGQSSAVNAGPLTDNPAAEMQQTSADQQTMVAVADKQTALSAAQRAQAGQSSAVNGGSLTNNAPAAETQKPGAVPQMIINAADQPAVRGGAEGVPSGQVTQSPIIAANLQEKELVTGQFKARREIKPDLELNTVKNGLPRAISSGSQPLSSELKVLMQNMAGGLSGAAVDSATETVGSGQLSGPAAQLAASSPQLPGLNAARGMPTVAVIPVPLGSPDWGEATAQRIVWMATNGAKAVQLHLNPQDLGPVEVQIHLNKDQASINFSSQHAQVREAVEASLQRLKEMFEGAGVNLVDVNVSDQSLAQHNESDLEEGASGSSETSQADEMVDGNPVQQKTLSSINLVDFYA